MEIIDLGEETKTNNKIDPELPHLESEVIYAVRNEMAVKPNDVICRRLGVGIVDDQIAKKLLPKVVEIMGNELKWSKD